MFPVTITIHNAVQLNAVINAMDGLPVPKGGVHGVVEGLHVANTSPVGGIAPQHHDSRAITAAEVREHRDQNGGTMAEAKAAVTKAKATEAKKPAPEPEKAPFTGTTSESEPLDAPLDSGDLTGDEKAYTMGNAQAMTKEAVVTGKRDAVIALLAKYNVEKTVHLKPEQVQPFCVEIEGLLK